MTEAKLASGVIQADDFIPIYLADAVGQGTWAVNTDINQYPLAFLFTNNASVTDADNFTINVYLPTGTYTLKIVGFHNTNGAIIDVDIDDTEVHSFDEYNASSGAELTSVTGVEIGSSGIHTIKFRVDGKNASSSGYKGYLTAIRFSKTA